MLKGTIKITFITFLSVILLSLIVPFNYIKAETQTYYIYDYIKTKTDNNIDYYGYYIDNVSSDYYYIFEYNSNYNLSSVRGNVFKVGNYYYFSIMLDTLNSYTTPLNFKGYRKSDNNIRFSSSSTKYVSNNYTGWYGVIGQNNVFNSYIDLGPNNVSGDNLYNLFYSYLYGDNSIDPIPPQPEIDYGNVTDVKFTTSFVSQSQTAYTQSMPYNKDTISWNIAKSDNGTDLYYSELIDSWEVDIMASRFYYGDVQENSLLLQQISNMHIIDTQQIIIGSYPIIKGSVSYTWGQIAQEFSTWVTTETFLDSLFILQSNGEYIIYGWLYKIRLRNDSLNYTSDWKIIYNTTATPSSSDTLLTNYYENYNYNYDYSVQNTYQTINEMNGDNSIYYLNSDVVYYNQTDDYTYNNNVVNNFSEIVNEVKEKEDDFNQTLDQNLTDIDLNEFDLTQWGNSFQNSAEWVKTQFNRMTIDTPIGSYLGFTLVVGLGLLIIGRIF